MREIEFRGKKIDTDEWVYGYYHYIPVSDKHCIDVPMEDFANSTLWHVKPETIGQYTGLKDKDGKKIYEKDTVKLKDDTFHYVNIGVVKFKDGKFILVYDSHGAEIEHIFGSVFNYQDMGATTVIHYSYEVTGNIFD